MVPPLQDIPFSPGQHQFSPTYTLQGLDAAGNPLGNDDILSQMILSIPYTGEGVAPEVLFAPALSTANALQATAAETSSEPTWTSYDNYVVDEANQKVIIFVEQWGTYALATTVIPEQMYLPLTLQ
jgi:hypothetical protein